MHVAIPASMLRTHARGLLRIAAFAPCACGATAGSSPDAGSADARSVVVVGDAASCAALSDAAVNALAPTFESASTNLACAIDSDCTVAPAGSDCTGACNGPITTLAGAASIQSAIEHVNATICATFKDENCSPPAGGACPSGSLGVACVQGTCKDFPPAAWVSFAFSQQPGAVGFSSPPSCTAGTSCTLWTVTPYAHVSVVDSLGTHEATMSTSDFATVDGILRSMSFRQSEMTGFTCDPSPGGQVISFDDSRGVDIEGWDATGCVLAGPSGNGIQALFDVVKGY
jgi:hypothetical protein